MLTFSIISYCIVRLKGRRAPLLYATAAHVLRPHGFHVLSHVPKNIAPLLTTS